MTNSIEAKKLASPAVPSNGCVELLLLLLLLLTPSTHNTVIVTDSIEEAKKFAEETWKATKDDEKAAMEKIKKVCACVSVCVFAVCLYVCFGCCSVGGEGAAQGAAAAARTMSSCLGTTFKHTQPESLPRNSSGGGGQEAQGRGDQGLRR